MDKIGHVQITLRSYEVRSLMKTNPPPIRIQGGKQGSVAAASGPSRKCQRKLGFISASSDTVLTEENNPRGEEWNL